MPTFLLLIHPDLRIVIAEEGEAPGFILDQVEAPSWAEAKYLFGFPITELDEYYAQKGSGTHAKDLW